MAGSLNKVMLIGNLGTDVEMKYFENGGCIGKFPIATSSEYTNKTTGEHIEKTEWHNIVVNNKGAEICEKYLSKGDKVFIEGKIETRKYQDQEGNDRYITQIRCRDFKFLTPKSQSGKNSTPPGQNPQQNPQQNQTQESTNSGNSHVSEASEEENEKDDLPF